VIRMGSNGEDELIVGGAKKQGRLVVESVAKQ
jgi:hypothetical protein